jgi:hypothetical protein
MIEIVSILNENLIPSACIQFEPNKLISFTKGFDASNITSIKIVYVNIKLNTPFAKRLTDISLLVNNGDIIKNDINPIGLMSFFCDNNLWSVALSNNWTN